MKKIGFILGLFCTTADAHILHVGDKTFQLDNVKRTSPALGVGIDGGTFYGALYSGDAPGQTLHVRRDASVYWLGQNCAAGKYSDNGITSCTDCGVGYYCTGGMSRTPCTYGAMSCNTKNNSTDQAMPAGAPLNNFLTLDEVNEFIPVTDFSDWRQISCCFLNNNYSSTADPETVNDASVACASGTLGPGTYLFTARYSHSDNTKIDSFTGTVTGLFSHAVIAVFDHPVGYASIHGNCIYQHFIDTDNANYTKWTISTAYFAKDTCWWRKETNETNISNLSDLPIVQNLCVYELK